MDQTLSLKENESKKLSLTVNNPEADHVITWSTSDGAVAELGASDNTGATVVAKKSGTATITATYTSSTVTAANSSIKATCQVTVEAATTPPVTNPTIAISPATFDVEVGKTTNLTATVTGTTSAVSWSSSNTQIATVNNNGVVTGKAAGSVTITAAAGGATDSVTGTVKEPLLCGRNGSI